ncbi:hypothetical protein LCY76_21100 [Fictibacillus sp. KIGAM418]|uniref:Uncharacterized protein n=1 Tax=Fictibacillus marinisediminis TaxID=2878389 RepID=A0A9X1XDW7_9BACL|nr:hypothetical protein [Fictibacillus marinisediminis]MCK6259072.1 hypothetical protein [Fictibacillus marinisediminis]
MNNETYLDFCFIRNTAGGFSGVIDGMFRELFGGQRLHWYLDEKKCGDIEMVTAEVKGMSVWESEAAVLAHLEQQGTEMFWKYIQGCQFSIYPAMKGCGSCGK